jgi:hypothetical protein
MRWLLFSMWMVLLPVAAMAQSGRGQAYVAAGPGNFKADDRVGYATAGAEYIGGAGIGIAAEINWLWGVAHYRGLDPFGGPPLPEISTVLGGVHVSVPLVWGYSAARVQPFAIAGISFVGKPIDDSNLWYMFGGGANVWISQHAAIRGELRLPHGSGRAGPIGVLGITVR